MDVVEEKKEIEIDTILKQFLDSTAAMCMAISVLKNEILNLKNRVSEAVNDKKRKLE